jgi:hypothetical protein
MSEQSIQCDAMDAVAMWRDRTRDRASRSITFTDRLTVPVRPEREMKLTSRTDARRWRIVWERVVIDIW